MWKTLLVVLFILETSYSKEVCCCPDLSVSLSCSDTSNVELENNGYRCVANTGASITLKCDVTDVGHEAIKSVSYQFHKATELEKVPLAIVSSGTTKKLNCDDTKSTCVLENVKWGQNTKAIDLDKHDSFIYQCYVTFTLVDDSPAFSIPSNTMWVDVLMNIDIAAKKAMTITPVVKAPVETGYPNQQMACPLETTNPPTKAVWYKQAADESSWTELKDLPDSIKARALVVDDTINAESTATQKGTLIIMIFAPTDAGFYKCEAKYDPVSSIGIATSYKVSQYQLQSNAATFAGTLELKMVSSVTSNKYFPSKARFTMLNDPVEFTCLATDTDATDTAKYTYRWTYESASKQVNVEIGIDPFKDGVELSNNGRTLILEAGYRFNDLELKCHVTYGNITKQSDVYKQPVIVPQKFQIPISKNCLAKNTDLILTPNKEYMMSENVNLKESEYKQKLPGATYKWFIGNTMITSMTNKASEGGITKETELKIPKDHKLLTDNSQKCKYFTFVQKHDNDYKVYETLKVTQTNSEAQCCSCADLNSGKCKDMLKIKYSHVVKQDSLITVTLPNYNLPCVSLLLKQDGIVVKTKDVKSKVAENSCIEEKNTPMTFTLKKNAKYTLSLSVEGCEVTDSMYDFSTDGGSDGSQTVIIIVVVVLGVIIIGAILGALYVYKTRPVVSKIPNNGDHVKFDAKKENISSSIENNQQNHSGDDVEKNDVLPNEYVVNGNLTNLHVYDKVDNILRNKPDISSDQVPGSNQNQKCDDVDIEQNANVSSSLEKASDMHVICIEHGNKLHDNDGIEHGNRLHDSDGIEHGNKLHDSDGSNLHGSMENTVKLEIKQGKSSQKEEKEG